MAKKSTIDNPSVNLDEELPLAPEPSDSPEEPAEAETQPEGTTPPPPTKKATPKPGDVDYDWSVHYPADAELYTHTFPDGTVVALKSFASIYSKTWMYKLRQLNSQTETEFAAIDRAACDLAREVLLNLDDTAGDPLAELFKTWLEAGTKNADDDKGLTPGE